MPYRAERPGHRPSTDELRQRIPGWGADLDPKHRPAVPKERFDPGASGAHWDFPERQEEKWPRERSIEHEFLTPVFGTSTPPKGLSGVMRKYSYARYGEGRSAHWLILLAADRVDAWENHIRSLLTLRPDNPLTETGISSEFTHHGFSSRAGSKRADLKHQWLDLIIVGGPWAAAGILAALVLRKMFGHRDS